MIASRFALVVGALWLAYSSLADATTFDFLTYNVAGLPARFNHNKIAGEKGDAATAIGSQLAKGDYDVVHLQEDFNFHAKIYAADDHPYRTPTSGPIPLGSGLNTVSNYNWTDFERISWSQCSLHGGDCLTPKGFTFMRLQLGEGVEVDFYNLHADAGTTPADRAARRAGIRQIVAYVNTRSAGRAVVVGGDMNERYAAAGGARGSSIAPLIDAGFADIWVQLVRDGVDPTGVAGVEADDVCDVTAAAAGEDGCEGVDKVLYRSGDEVELEAMSWGYETKVFLRGDGSVTSDHKPVHVRFEVTKV